MTAGSTKEETIFARIAGIVLMIIGGIFLFEEMGFADFGDVIESYWPMIVVLVGVVNLFSRETAGNGLWLILVGAWLQISHMGLFGLSWATSWPLLLIVIGAGMVGQSLFGGRDRKKSAATDNGGAHGS